MSLTYCTNCHQVEPETREITSSEIDRVGYEPEDTRICTGCESIYDTLTEVPEHDDLEDR